MRKRLFKSENQFRFVYFDTLETDMELEFRCPIGRSDIRDYTFIDVLQKIGREQGSDLRFAVWDYAAEADETGSTEQSSEEQAGKLPKEELPKAKYVIYSTHDKTWQGYLSYQSAYESALHEVLSEPREESQPVEELAKGKIFRQYPLRVYLPSDPNIIISSTSVIIPLNFSRAAFKIAISEGRLTLKDGNNCEVGSLKLLPAQTIKASQVKWSPSEVESGDEPQEFAGELVVDQSGQLILQSPSEPIFLRLGTGFTRFEMDVNAWPPVENQAPMHLCAANAGVALLEYFERKSDGRHINASRLFLHQAACHLMNVSPTGAPSVRAVVTALYALGVLPEEFWAYEPSKLEQEPPAWCYAHARNFRAESYMRIDRPGMDKTALVDQIKVFVYSGIPAIFGFHVHEAVQQSMPLDSSDKEVMPPKSLFSAVESFLKDSTASQTNDLKDGWDAETHFYQPGCIPLPTVGELYQGGHAAIAIGYADDKIIVNSHKLRQQDREKLYRQTNKAFLFNDKKLEPWNWDSKSQTYKKSDSIYDLPNQDPGLFILLIKRPLSPSVTKDDESSTVLIPQDVLDRERSPFLLENRATGGTLENTYLVEEYLATKGAFKIRNSWGNQWGEKGYGWLPYAYVHQDLTFDWWSTLKFEWLNTEEFGLLRDGNSVLFCSPWNGCS